MIDHGALKRALRTRLRTLSVCTTGSVTLAATATGYSRASGSFLTDGFRVGMELVPTGFSDSAAKTIRAVSALAITTEPAPTATNVAASGRTLAVGLPASVAYENVAHTPPDTPAPWVGEQYLPGPMARITMGPSGLLEVLPLYIVTVYTAIAIDTAALDAYLAALLNHFAPGTPIPLDSGDFFTVRGDPAPFQGQVLSDGTGARVACTIPLRHRTTNSR